MRTIAITGAASGVGRGLAERFLAAGDRVVGMDIQREALDALAAAWPGRFHAAPCDLTRQDQMEQAARAAESVSGSVDILIHSAGIVAGRTVIELDPETLERIFRVNVFAPFALTRLLLPGMLRAGSGHIVTVASAGGLVATTRMAAYASSKFAAVGFDEALRLELRSMQAPVTTTVICPYYIDTGMFDGVMTRFSWLLPILSTREAVDRMYRAIEKRKKRLIMPRFVHAVFLARLLPVTWFDSLMTLLGVTSSMDEFSGR